MQNDIKEDNEIMELIHFLAWITDFDNCVQW